MLDKFSKVALGQVYLANAYLAYKNPDIYNYGIKEHLKESEKICTLMSSENIKKVIEEFPSSKQNEWKYRTWKSGPILRDNLTTIISIESFASIVIDDPDSPSYLGWLFDFETISEQVPDQPIDRVIKENLGYFSKKKAIDPDFIKEGAELGRKDNPKWLAPAGEINRIKKTDKDKQADNIREALGLAHYRKNAHLIQITLSKSSIENLLDDEEIYLAAPLFIDAKANNYFRAYFDCPDYWGRTQHLTDKMHPGIKEAIVSPIPLAKTDIGISYLGTLKREADNSENNIAKHAQSLLPKDKTISDIRAELIELTK